MSDKKGFAAKLKGVVSDGGSKKLLIFAGVMVGIAVIYSMIPAEQPASNPGAYTSAPSASSIQGRDVLPPAYDNALSKDDRERRNQAQASGGTNMPTLRVSGNQPDTPILLPPKDQEPPSPPQPNKPEMPVIEQKPVIIAPTVQPNPIVTLPTPMQATADTERLKAAMSELGRRNYAVAEVQYMYAAQPASTSPQSAPSIPSLPPGSNSRVKLPLAGEVVYAQLIGRANSDAPGPVIAQILQGPLTGARLVGSFSTGRDALVITFNKLTMKKGPDGEEINEVVDINAVAVDTKHIGTALATSVDRHLFQKLAIGLAASFADGFGKAVGTKNSNSVLRSDGSYTTMTERLTGREQILSAGGQAISSAGNILMDEFGRRPTTIIVDAETPIGVLFL